MPSEANIIFDIISIALIFVYQFILFSYVSKILLRPKNNKLVFLLLTIINATLLYLFLFFQLPISWLYIFIMIALTIEFKMISSADIIQSLCGSTIVAMHIATINAPIINIVASAYEITPFYGVYQNDITQFISIGATCGVLIIAMLTVDKLIPHLSIQRITTRNKYSVLMLICTFTILLYQAISVNFIITDEIYRGQLIMALATSSTCIVCFYFAFLYAMKLLDANLYKRYSDNAIEERKKIDSIKASLSNKIERDSLTNTYNRKFVFSMLEEMCEQSSTTEFNVLFVDINALKYVNDNYGHECGDRLIIKIAKAITNAVREDDVVARIGGDEFLVILCDSTQESCIKIVDRIYANIEMQNNTENFPISASVGSIFVDEEVKKKGDKYIISVADENMRINKALYYKRKEEGGKWVFFYG